VAYSAEWRKIERYCQEQRVVLRQLEDLNAREQQMYELNNDKDQVMTVCKVALANLAMWTRDRFFPTTMPRRPGNDWCHFSNSRDG
jgi:hypothetical protein